MKVNRDYEGENVYILNRQACKPTNCGASLEACCSEFFIAKCQKRWRGSSGNSVAISFFLSRLQLVDATRAGSAARWAPRGDARPPRPEHASKPNI